MRFSFFTNTLNLHPEEPRTPPNLPFEGPRTPRNLHPEEPRSGVSKDEGFAQIPPSFETRKSAPQDEGFLERPLRIAIALAVMFFTAFPAHAAEWKANERIKYYDVSGDTGLALYKAIGAKGPMFGGSRRAIGLTEYDLKWRRDYKPENGNCRLASATPLLTITYSLPRAKPSGALARRWQAFADGIETHERVHGAHIRDMVDAIIAVTVGLTVENDPKCTKIRAEVLNRVKAALAAYIARTRAFEAEEMGNGGNVHRLILGLVE